MQPNYYPGKPPEEQPEPIKWAGKKPTPKELKQILEDHTFWTRDAFAAPGIGRKKGPPPHDMREVDIRQTDLREAVLAWVPLARADLRGVVLSGVHLYGADMCGARLYRADLRRARLISSNLRKANFEKSDLRETEVCDADLRGATLTGAKLHGADVTGVRTNRRTKFLGARGIANTHGSAKFRDRARHQEYIEELRTTWWGKWIVHPLWLIFADCGRTPWAWLAWCLAFVFFFAYAFSNWAGPGSFHIPHLPDTFQTMLYYSVVTFTTLGFGDVVPKTNAAAWWVMAEVCLGYVMLGGLISIFATKLVARRG